MEFLQFSCRNATETHSLACFVVMNLVVGRNQTARHLVGVSSSLCVHTSFLQNAAEIIFSTALCCGGISGVFETACYLGNSGVTFFRLKIATKIISSSSSLKNFSGGKHVPGTRRLMPNVNVHVAGDAQIGNVVAPLDPTTVGSVVRYGTVSGNYTYESLPGTSLVYSQLYNFTGLLNYTSGIIHHVQLTG